MSLRILFLTMSVFLTSLLAQAAYTVHSVEGNVTVARKTGEIAATKGMELNANEILVIGNNAKIEIYNTLNKEIYSSTTPGRISVMDVMMNARKSAGSHLSTMNNYVRFGAKERSNTRQYTEGSVKRAMQTYDPEGGSLTIDPLQLANNVLAGISTGTPADEIPLDITYAPMGETGLEFRVFNTLSFPVYLNVLTVDSKGGVELSELGQPTGCYVLLPGQAISREHADGLKKQKQVLVITHCQFDIDDLLSAITDLQASKQPAKPDPSLPVYELVF